MTAGLLPRPSYDPRSHAGRPGATLYVPISEQQAKLLHDSGAYQFWALIRPNHPLDASGQPLPVVSQSGFKTVRAPFLRVLHKPPKKYGTSNWKWIRLTPDHFFTLLRQFGLVMRRKTRGKVIRLFNDPRIWSNPRAGQVMGRE